MRLDELFDVRNGIASTSLHVSLSETLNSVPYLRPASTQQRTIAGWVKKYEVGEDNIYPPETLFVSTNGEGSHSYAYVSQFDFACNSDVSVLIPKRDMTLHEKVYYARCITMNRFKFSYGRKPKGNRLKTVELPNSPPEWVPTTNIYTDRAFPALLQLTRMAKEFDYPTRTTGKPRVPISHLFDVYYGTNHELNALEIDPQGVNFVSRTEKNNGVSARVKRLPEDPIPGGVLTVAGGGSVLATFLQTKPFYSGRDLFYLVPKLEMPTDILLFYAHCIKLNKFRYSYGRQANRTLRSLLIPALEELPPWVTGSLERTVNRVRESLQNIYGQPPK